MLPELCLRANQCLVDVLLDDCVEPGTGSGIPGSWKPGGKRNEPQLLDFSSSHKSEIPVDPDWPRSRSWSASIWCSTSSGAGLTLRTSPRSGLGTSASRPPEGLLLLLLLCWTLCLGLCLSVWILLSRIPNHEPDKQPTDNGEQIESRDESRSGLKNAIGNLRRTLIQSSRCCKVETIEIKIKISIESFCT